MMFKTSSSLYILTPSFNALSYLVPGLSPPITPVVFLVTELVTLAPFSSRILVNSSILYFSKVPVKTNVIPDNVSSDESFLYSKFNPSFFKSSINFKFKGSSKYVLTLLAIISPISLTFVSSSILTLIILSIFLYLLASILAVFLPTCLIPNAKSTFSNEFDFEFLILSSKLLTLFSPKPSSSIKSSL